MKTKIFAITGLALLTGACATGPKVQPEKLAKVKNVAVVGFEVVQQQPAELEFSLGGSSNDGMPPPMPVSKIPVSAPHAEEVYNVLRKTCQQDMGWTMRDTEALRKNAEYQAVLKKQTSGIRSLPPVPATSDVFGVAGVMDWWAWEKATPTDRREAIKTLKTDAVLVVRARSELKEGFSFKKLYGGGNFQPQVTYELKMYGTDGEDVFWSDYAVRGEPTEKTVGHFAGISSKEALNKLVVEASAGAAKKLRASREGGKK
jgi:hypothetical protein